MQKKEDKRVETAADGQNDSYLLQFANLAEKHRESSGKKKNIVIAFALALILGVGGGIFFTQMLIRNNSVPETSDLLAEASLKAAELINSAKTSKERKSTLILINKYLDSGLYDNALSLINGLVISNPDDKEVLALLDEAVQLKKDELAGLTPVRDGASRKEGISVEAQAEIDRLREEIARQNLESEKQKKAADDMKLLREQEKSAARKQEEAKRKADEKAAAQKLAEEKKAQEQAESRKKAEEQARLAEAERKAQREAEAKQRAEQEARRKAEEERKAQESAAAAKLIKDINSEIAQGKVALASGDVVGAISYFNKAKMMLPANDKEFCAGKLSEITNALYDASRNASFDESKRQQMMRNAVIYAGDTIAMNSAEPGAHYILAMNAFDAKDYAKAESELNKAVASDKSNSVYLYQLGRAQAQLKKYDASSTSFQQSIKYNQNYAPAQYNLGYVSEKLNRTTQALTAYKQAYKIDADYEKAYLAAGRLMLRKSDYDGAVEAFRQSVRVNPSSSQNYQELGNAQSLAGDNVAAEQSFKKAIAYMSATQKDPVTFYNLSAVMHAQGKNSDALSYAKTAYDNKGRASKTVQANIIYNYALMCDETGNDTLAISLYKEVLAKDPQNVKALTNLGVLCLEQNEADVAVSFLQQAYSKDPRNFVVNNNLGNACRMKSDYESAITYYQNALRIQPKDNTVRDNLAKTYASAKQFDNAKVTYEDVITSDAQAWSAYFELAQVCLSLNNSDEARKYLQMLQSKNPSYRSAEVTNLLKSM